MLLAHERRPEQHRLVGEERWLQILPDEPMLLRTPLVRQQHKLTVGPAEAEWKAWLAAAK